MKSDNDINAVKRRMLSPKRMAIQIIGFLIGAVLVIWCIKTAISGADWTKLRDADPGMIIALLATGLFSTVVDGFVFWGVLRPYRNLNAAQVQGVNMTASFLNYAPVRLGTVFRVIYHARVDGVPLVPILGWFAAITLTTIGCMASVFAATLIVGKPNFTWMMLLAFFLLVTGVSIWILAKIPIVQRYGKGIERMFGDPQALVAGLVGRLIVLASNSLRMGITASILGLELDVSAVVLLSIAALMLSFNPLGRFGWREATVTLVTAHFASDALGGQNVDAVAAQLALVESAGEALVVVPLGIITSIWAFPRLIRSRSRAGSSITSSSEPPGADHHPTEGSGA